MKTKTKNNSTTRWKLLHSLAKPLIFAITILALGATGFAAKNANAEIETWGPQDRATFTWKEPADYVTFNSMTDNPEVGDERNFVRVRKAGTTDTYSDNVTIEPGAEYEVFVWYHNNAKARLNTEQNGIGIANNIRLKLEIPEIVAAGHAAAIKATLSADNATPHEVWDLAFAEAEQGVALRFVPNSAVVHLNEPGTYDEAKGGWYDSKGHQTIEGEILSEDALFNRDGYGGAKLAYWNTNWGYLPACSEYSGYVTFRLKADQPNFEIHKTVSKEGENNFGETITVNPGDTLEFKIQYDNTGTTIQQPVTMDDNLPEGLTYIEGSSYFWSSRHNEGNPASDNLFHGGLNLGGFEPGDSAYVTYKVRVEDDEKLFPCGDTVVYNEGRIGTDNGTGHDQVAITVHRECPNGGGSTETCATNPNLPGCQELPNTGPVEIVIAVLIAGSIGGVIYYFCATRRNLKRVESDVMGDKRASHYHHGLDTEPEETPSDSQIKHAKKSKKSKK